MANAGFKCIIEKIGGCKNNSTNSSTKKASIFNQVSQCLLHRHLEA